MKPFPMLSSYFQLNSTLLISGNDPFHSAQYLAVLDHDIPKHRECGTESLAFEQLQKLVPSLLTLG